MNIWQRFRHMVVHRRLPIFWTVAVIGVVGPWVLHRPLWAEPGRGTGIQTLCEVASVHDGDTMTVNCPRRRAVKIRLYCIDAPEIAQVPWGRQSREHFRGLVGESVTVSAHGQERYGRTLAEVFSGRRNLNLQQVRNGWAAQYDRYCSEPAYRDAEQAAKDSGAGIWSSPGLHQTPWVWRRNR